MLACALLGLAIERLAYRPLRRAPRLNVLITAIGVSLLLQNIGQLNFVFGAIPQRMPGLLPRLDVLNARPGPGARRRGAVTVDLIDLVICGTAAVLVVVLEWLVFTHEVRDGDASRVV